MVKEIFTIPGVSAFLSDRICQYPLENVFGQQRQQGRVNENPNAREFTKNTQTMRIVNGLCSNVRGNCRGGSVEGNTESPKLSLQKRTARRVED